MEYKAKAGAFGQKLAADFLKSRGYAILAENFQTREGELDLIAELKGQLIFVEVKTRLTDKYGLPEEAVSSAKLEKMQAAAAEYLSQNQVNHENYRFDIIAVEIDRAQSRARIRHHKNILV